MISRILFSTIGVSVISMMVFGGGQVFLPMFTWLFSAMEIDQEKIDLAITAANSTPGVFSTQMAVFAGYFAAEGMWWVWLLMFASYLLYALPAFVMIWWAYKFVNKSETSKYMKNMITWLKPFIVGMIIAAFIQLFISTTFPKIIFNSVSDGYFGIKNNYGVVNFFSGWRGIVLITYSAIVPFETILLIRKGVPLAPIIFAHMLIGTLLFAPWA